MNANIPVEDVTMALGEGSFSLPENPTTGYLWYLVESPEGVVMLGDEFVPNSGEARRATVGGGGERKFRVRVDRGGSYELRLVQKRSWEPTPIEQRTVRLKVA